MAVSKKVPLRKCVVTQEMRPKKELIRIVRDKEGNVFVDPTGKKNGRGAYVTKSLDVIETAKKTDAIKRHLNTDVDPEIFEQLKKVAEGQKIE